MSNDAVSAVPRATINPLVLEMARQARLPRTITFSAARRRYERKEGEKIITLTQRESQFLGAGLAHYAICNNNTLTTWGDIEAVNEWCREAGVLAHDEIVVEAA
ncbi:hypothetical protein J6500_22145 [Bradyrhizobium sp. WSM 1704]|uniref:hypothetical protein n=1 Tax=Bradyrhizobium semiaridum TaxID=2821404 RepID=UPI001CE338FF|nr:hypothetical protein [Bradyrhizobium semiaridum]MCA6124573.1 hypothetical protein [Bradyrhizobium semiaridum]